MIYGGALDDFVGLEDLAAAPRIRPAIRKVRVGPTSNASKWFSSAHKMHAEALRSAHTAPGVHGLGRTTNYFGRGTPGHMHAEALRSAHVARGVHGLGRTTNYFGRGTPGRMHAEALRSVRASRGVHGLGWFGDLGAATNRPAYQYKAYACPAGGGASGARQQQLKAERYCKAAYGYEGVVASCSPFSWYCDPTRQVTKSGKVPVAPAGQISYPGYELYPGSPNSSFYNPGTTPYGSAQCPAGYQVSGTQCVALETNGMCPQGATSTEVGSTGNLCVAPMVGGLTPPAGASPSYAGASCPYGYVNQLYGSQYYCVPSQDGTSQTSLPAGSYLSAAGQACQVNYEQELINNQYYCVPSNAYGTGTSLPAGSYLMSTGQACQYGYAQQYYNGQYYCVPSGLGGSSSILPPGAVLTYPGQACSVGYSQQIFNGQYYCVPGTGLAAGQGNCPAGDVFDPSTNSCIAAVSGGAYSYPAPYYGYPTSGYGYSSAPYAYATSGTTASPYAAYYGESVPYSPYTSYSPYAPGAYMPSGAYAPAGYEPDIEPIDTGGGGGGGGGVSMESVASAAPVYADYSYGGGYGPDLEPIDSGDVIDSNTGMPPAGMQFTNQVPYQQASGGMPSPTGPTQQTQACQQETTAAPSQDAFGPLQVVQIVCAPAGGQQSSLAAAAAAVGAQSADTIAAQEIATLTGLGRYIG